MFIDDMNMPQVDLYGTQQPIALLKLLLEKGGMYDRGKDLNWKLFKDIVLVAAMGKVRTERRIHLNLTKCPKLAMGQHDNEHLCNMLHHTQMRLQSVH